MYVRKKDGAAVYCESISFDVRKAFDEWPNDAFPATEGQNRPRFTKRPEIEQGSLNEVIKKL
jgi:hypothetical protein